MNLIYNHSKRNLVAFRMIICLFVKIFNKLSESDWDKNFGDRKNELVFIGQDMDEKLI